MNKNFDPEIWMITRRKFNPSQWLNKPAEPMTKEPFPQVNETFLKHDVEVVMQRIEYCRIDLTMNYEDWIKLGFAFADEFGELGRDYFHRVSRFYADYDITACNRQFDKCLKGNKSGVTIKTFFAAAKDAGISIRV